MSIAYLKKLNLEKDLGKLSFLIGVFLLPSAFSLSLFFLLIALIISLKKNKKNFLTDKYNVFLILASIWLIISSTVHSLRNEFASDYNWDQSLSWIGLVNWIPLFICFYGFQFYLQKSHERKDVALILLSGTFPVIISGLGQSFFDWNGPLETLGGLIVWYQRPLEKVTSLTGLFNNPNYAGIWLNIVWPFCLAFLFIKRKKIFQIISTYSFTFGIFITTVLTNSRSAWIGLLIGFFLMIGRKITKIIPKLIVIFILILICSAIPLINNLFENIYQIIIPNQSWIDIEQNEISRLDIWLSALRNIFENPIFGTGSGSFPKIFISETGIFKGHPHNLILELIISYGIPAGLFVFYTVSKITFLSFHKIIVKKSSLNENYIFEKAWITALVIFCISQIVDVQYFDGRISILFWILLSGSRNIIRNNSLKNK